MKPGCSSELQEIEASDAQLFQIKVLMFSVFHPISCFFFWHFVIMCWAINLPPVK